MDESGNQLAVFGRRGARPFNLAEMQRMYLLDGKLFTVSDSPATPAQPFKSAANKPAATDDKTPTGPAEVSLNMMLPRAHTARTQAFVGGGLGLLFIAAGWRRLRRRARRT